MKKRLSALILLSIFLLPFAAAQATVSKTVNEATVSPLGEASFDVTITNNGLDENTFVLELSDVAWSLRTAYAPDYTTGIVLGGKESRNTKIFIKPSADLAAGTHYVELRARSRETGEVTSQIFIITIDPKVVDYSTTIPIEILEPTSIDPAKTNSIKALVKNPYTVYMQNLEVTANSKFLSKKATFDLPPKSEKVLEFSLNIDSSTPKQEDEVTISVTQNGTEIANAKKTIYIKEYRLPYKSETVDIRGFLHLTHQITFTNTESVQKTQDASVLRPHTWAFVLTDPDAVADVFDGQNYLTWSGISLTPGQTYVVTVTEDYRPVAGLGLVLVLAIIAYYMTRSPIVVRKKAYSLHMKDRGNNEMKVVLHIKNRTGRTLEKVRVLDRLPVIHRVEEDFGPGTPEPKYRRHGTEGIILDWDIMLAPHEERIFTYKVKSSLPIVGEYTLKPCVVQYGSQGKRTSSGPYRMVID